MPSKCILETKLLAHTNTNTHTHTHTHKHTHTRTHRYADACTKTSSKVAFFAVNQVDDVRSLKLASSSKYIRTSDKGKPTLASKTNASW